MFSRNNRGLVNEVFGSIGKALLFIVEIGIILFIVLFILAYFLDLSWLGLGGLSATSHSLIDKTPIGAAFKGIREMASTAFYNPTSFEEQEAKTTQSTETKSSTGVKLTDDTTDRTGIMSPNPRSLQEYTIKIGVKNPMKDFVAANSKLSLGNAGNVTNKTGLDFGQFTWETGKTTETLQPNSYLSASADSTTQALKVTSDAESSGTNVFMEVDYSYDFKSAVTPNLPGVAANGLKMYQAKFIVSSYDEAQKISSILDKYMVTEKAAGGPVEITRTIVEPYLEPGKKLSLVFKIRNSDPNAGVFEAIEFKGGSTSDTSDNILLIAPNEFIRNSSNLILASSATGYQTYKIKGLLSNGNLDSLKNSSCDIYGCRFDGYNGFASNSRILTDEPGSNEVGFTAVFKLNETMDPYKVYNVYIAFLDGAYTYHAAMKKLIAVQP